MPVQSLKHTASEGPYFHPDFHIALNYGLEYLREHFGKEAVREFLVQFAANHHQPLKKKIAVKGLHAIREHFENIFKIEKAKFEMKTARDELVIALAGSPAVRHIRAGGHEISPLFHETVITVNKELCRDTPFDCELLEYEKETGAYRIKFYKKAK